MKSYWKEDNWRNSWVEQTARDAAKQVIEITDSILESRTIGENDICQKCETRKATELWVGAGSTLDYVHGNFQKWCKRCCLEEQLKYHKEAVERISGIEKELKELIESEEEHGRND